ncbi:ferric reductase transmembrane domain-containing protein [Hyphomicrobium denitrificans 1NES1]|uniref:Ferric reductase transmembrane domain-containing protein n=1 Tax=Hyphomicrobium denitrificans 1NES1 TaxID=670307 RepID=N0B1M6_9HYPH|nr:ferric reductase transmembrane domain-containing protein [Hyphomicrobium denitrificans 1NES1]
MLLQGRIAQNPGLAGSERLVLLSGEFGEALRRDFTQKRFPIHEQFHQELFAMR